jgi:hypothetical protein
MNKMTDEEVKSYRPMFLFEGEEAKGNALRFATHDEADGNARDKFSVWSMPSGYYVQETDDPVNYTWDVNQGTKPL